MIDMMEYDIAQLKPNLTVCPKYEDTFAILGKKWNALIIDVLHQKPCRFSEIARAIEFLSDRVLAERLRELESEDIIERTSVNSSERKNAYQLTEKGKALAKATQSLKNWAENWM